MKTCFLFRAPNEYTEATEIAASPDRLYAVVSTHGWWAVYWAEPHPDSTDNQPGWRLGAPGEEPRLLYRGAVREIGLTYSDEGDCLIDELDEIMPRVHWKAWLSAWWRANALVVRHWQEWHAKQPVEREALSPTLSQEPRAESGQQLLDEDFLAELQQDK